MHAKSKQSTGARSILQPFYPRALTGKAFDLAGRQSIYQISIPACLGDIHQHFLAPFMPFLSLSMPEYSHYIENHISVLDIFTRTTRLETG